MIEKNYWFTKEKVRGFDISPENDFWDYAVLYEDIKNAPIEDVAPIKHGYWTRHGDGSVTCSVCGRRLSDVVYGYPYSACCGAKMDLK